MNNTVSDLCHEIKSEYCVKNKITFLSSKTFLFFFKHKYIPFSWKGIFLGFLRIQLPRHFLQKQILQNIDMLQQKPWHLPTAKASFECRCFIDVFYKYMNTTSYYEPLAKIYSNPCS